MHPLSGYLIVDLSSGIAGGYCTKLLADGGAEVVKVEPPGGDPLRSWSASGGAVPAGEDGALFKYLGCSKRSVVTDPAGIGDLLAAADAAIWTPGSPLDPATFRRKHGHLIVTSITPFGLDGPWCERPATEFTLQAWSGGVIGLGRGDPERAPVFVGGQVGLWLAGAFAAAGTLVSLAGSDGSGELVDLSVLEVLASCLTYYPVTYFERMGRPFRPGRSVITPGVGLAKDGMLGVGVGTGQHWFDFCAMVGHPEWTEDPSLFRERSHLAPVIDEWFAAHTVEEIRDLANAFRLPNALIGNGANLAGLDHFEARRSFGPNPGGDFLQPAPPYHLTPASLRPPAPAPRLGAHSDQTQRDAAPRPEPIRFEGLRVLDLTAFWAGPFCTHVLALLGAEVIHVESTQRLDGTRMLGPGFKTEQWWERSPIFSGINTNKKSLTLDLQSERGMDLLRRLIATADVVVENYTPRVFEHLGLTFDELRSIRDDIVLVRMPGFGLDGPWRDSAAFAYTIEDASGLTWLTGHPDQKPMEPYCVGDPNAGVHALIGLLLALEHRRRTGEGVAIEAAMVDAAINITAEQVIEYSAHGALLERAGNRGPTAAPQNVYLTCQPDEWVAIAVATDQQWEALRSALGQPAWAADPVLAEASGRRRLHDPLDEHLGEWCLARGADEIVETLWPAGVPVARVMQPHNQAALAQLEARRFFEIVDHPIAGSARHSTLPMRFSGRPGPLHTRSAPLLGEHNGEILTGIGLTEAEIGQLEQEGVIGRVPRS